MYPLTSVVVQRMIKVHKSTGKILISILVADFIISLSTVRTLFIMGGFPHDGKLVLVVTYAKGYLY